MSLRDHADLIVPFLLAGGDPAWVERTPALAKAPIGFRWKDRGIDKRDGKPRKPALVPVYRKPGRPVGT
jgi:hypothetical protein